MKQTAANVVTASGDKFDVKYEFTPDGVTLSAEELHRRRRAVLHHPGYRVGHRRGERPGRTAGRPRPKNIKDPVDPKWDNDDLDRRAVAAQDHLQGCRRREDLGAVRPGEVADLADGRRPIPDGRDSPGAIGRGPRRESGRAAGRRFADAASSLRGAHRPTCTKRWSRATAA